MSARLIQLLTLSFLCFCVGVATFPFFFPSQVEKKEVVVKKAPILVRDQNVDDWSNDDAFVDDNDATWEEEPEDTTPDRRIAGQDDERFDEEDVPIDPKQNVVPEARVNAEFSTALAEMRRTAEIIEKQEKDNYKNDEFKAEDWANPEKLYYQLMI